MLSFQHVFGTLAHVTGQHHRHALLGQHRCDVRLAAAPLPCRQRGLRHDFVIVANLEDGIVVAMTKMVIHMAIHSGNSDFERSVGVGQLVVEELHHLIGDIFEGLTNEGIAVGKQAVLIFHFFNILNQRNLSQQAGIELFGEFLTATFAEKEIFLVGMFLRGEPRHILHDTDQRHIHLGDREHLGTFARVVHGQHLRGGDHDGAVHLKLLHGRNLDVARAGRKVDDEVVEFAPLGLGNQLRQGTGGHGTTPDDGQTVVHQQTQRDNLEAIFLNGHEVLLLAHVGGVHRHIFHSKHLMDGRAVDVSIHHAHTITLFSQSKREVCGNGRFAHTALSRGDHNNLSDVLHFVLCHRCIFITCHNKLIYCYL